jgi:tRNA-2-methylthio-N6-dimethylallyladenosine synthase
MFKYSPREKTKAWELGDDIDEEVKTKRIIEIVELQKEISEEKNSKLLGKEYEIIVEGISRKSDKMLFGRTDGNKSVIIPKNGTSLGEKVTVRINKTNSATLFGEIIHKN